MKTFFTRRRLVAMGAAAILAGVVANPRAQAVLTPVGAPHPGEKSIVDILNNTYGGTFTAAGDDFDNGLGITAQRIDDDHDQLWSGNFIAASAKGRFAGAAQQFGYISGHAGGSYTSLFDTTGFGFAASGDADLTGLFEDGSELRWARAGGGNIWSSLQADNTGGGLDHLVSFRILGLNGSDVETYMLFWEDLNLGDADYNDLAVEIQKLAAIPEPVTAALALMSLSAVGVAMRRRRGLSPRGF